VSGQKQCPNSEEQQFVEKPVRPPLEKMRIRTPVRDAAYKAQRAMNKGLLRKTWAGTRGEGLRNAGRRAHQGWDLYASVGTPVFAITGGTVVRTENDPKNSTGFGRYISLQFTHVNPRDGRLTTFYAFYAHLESISVKLGAVREGAVLGHTGISGNAAGGPPHLHFGILTVPDPRKGLSSNVDPGDILGYLYINLDEIDPWTDSA
jgi:murein DD-endopeptidase MepM/ murein hydrolase activator NlpD